MQKNQNVLFTINILTWRISLLQCKHYNKNCSFWKIIKLCALGWSLAVNNEFLLTDIQGGMGYNNIIYQISIKVCSYCNDENSRPLSICFGNGHEDENSYNNTIFDNIPQHKNNQYYNQYHNYNYESHPNSNRILKM